MPRVPSKSPFARDRTGGLLSYRLTRERVLACPTPSDQGSDTTPPHAFPFLLSSPNVEDVVYVFVSGATFFEEFCESLTSNPDSKAKRSTIPMDLRNNLSGERSSVLWSQGGDDG